MTETEMILLSAGLISLVIIVLTLGAIHFWLKAQRVRREIEEEEYRQKVEKVTSINIDSLNKLSKPAEKPLSTPPASESPKKVDWEPDDYKDLSDGLPVDVKTKFKKHNYKRFEKDELDELGELTPHQLKKIGG